MSKSELFTYLESLSSGNDTLASVALNLAVVFALMLFVFLVYRLVHLRSMTFNAGFGFVILLTGLVTGVIMMIIENNLALSLGMVGALSIVRYRSAIKDPKDTGFIFWAVAEGLCAGTGNYVLGVASCLIIGACVLVYCLFLRSFPVHLLIVRGKALDCDAITGVLKKNKVKYQLKLKNLSFGTQEYIFKVNAKAADSVAEQLSALENVETVSLALEGEE